MEPTSNIVERMSLITEEVGTTDLEFVNAFIAELKQCLETRGDGDFKMLDSCIENIPTGMESGVFYAIDFGGTNLRVARVELDAELGIKSMEQRRAALNELGGDDGSTFEKGLLDPNAPASALFGRIALKLKETMDEFGDSEGDAKPVGFTFSFPSKQTKLDDSVLVVWTKEFETGRNTEDPVEGVDVGALLASHMERLGVNGRLVAVCNDTVGTLLSARHERKVAVMKAVEEARKSAPTCTPGLLQRWFGCGAPTTPVAEQQAKEMLQEGEVEIGLILGTGVNACFADAICQSDFGYTGSIINIEMGNFRVSEKAPSMYVPELDGALDQALDQVTAGKQQLEKMCSGRYLGELSRRLFHLLAAAQGDDLKDESHPLCKMEGFGADLASLLVNPPPEGQEVHELQALAHIMEGLDDRQQGLLVTAAKMIFTRSALLAAGSIYAIAKFAALHKLVVSDRAQGADHLERISAPLQEGEEAEVETVQMPLVCAVDGSLYTHNPEYVKTLEQAIADLSKLDMQHEAETPATTKVRRALELKIKLVKADDGSGKGAAIAVACHSSSA